MQTHLSQVFYLVFKTISSFSNQAYYAWHWIRKAVWYINDHKTSRINTPSPIFQNCSLFFKVTKENNMGRILEIITTCQYLSHLSHWVRIPVLLLTTTGDISQNIFLHLRIEREHCLFRRKNESRKNRRNIRVLDSPYGNRFHF